MHIEYYLILRIKTGVFQVIPWIVPSAVKIERRSIYEAWSMISAYSGHLWLQPSCWVDAHSSVQSVIVEFSHPRIRHILTLTCSIFAIPMYFFLEDIIIVRENISAAQDTPV